MGSNKRVHMSERVEYQPEYCQPHSKKDRNKNPKDLHSLGHGLKQDLKFRNELFHNNITTFRLKIVAGRKPFLKTVHKIQCQIAESHLALCFVARRNQNNFLIIRMFGNKTELHARRIT